MDGLISEMSALAHSPFAWAAMGMIGLFALGALWRWRVCPLLGHGADAYPPLPDYDPDSPPPPGPRYLLLMVAGITATVAGLTAISEGRFPIFAFYLVVAGLFVIQTEPVRLQVREAEFRVRAAAVAGEEAAQAALERLRSTHIWLVSLHFIIFAGGITFLCAFY
ncbi:MAG: hypothetical protein ACFBSD_05855 [Paracoccaceae bacterium]